MDFEIGDGVDYEAEFEKLSAEAMEQIPRLEWIKRVRATLDSPHGPGAVAGIVELEGGKIGIAIQVGHDSDADVCYLLHETCHAKYHNEPASERTLSPGQMEFLAHQHVLFECHRRGYTTAFRKYFRAMERASLTHAHEAERDAAEAAVAWWNERWPE